MTDKLQLAYASDIFTRLALKIPMRPFRKSYPAQPCPNAATLGGELVVREFDAKWQSLKRL
jgi:hypothetical protein